MRTRISLRRRRKKEKKKKRKGRQGGIWLLEGFFPLFEGEIQTPTFSKMSLIKIFKKVIIHATSNLMSSC